MRGIKNVVLQVINYYGFDAIVLIEGVTSILNFIIFVIFYDFFYINLCIDIYFF